MSDSEPLHLEAQVLLIQRHQLNAASGQLGDMVAALDRISSGQNCNEILLDDLLAQAEVLACGHREVPCFEQIDIDKLLSDCETASGSGVAHLEMLDAVKISGDDSWERHVKSADEYVARNNVPIASRPFLELMSDTQRIAFEKRILEEFSFKGANCDKFDYMIAGTCGLIGGLVDILFVGLPGEGPLGSLADQATDGLVEKFATVCGWKGARGPERSTASAIGFLEKAFKVNYDHRHGGDVGGAFDMRTTNHHIKSLAHSPDLTGLFFSLLNQFTSTASFVSDGSLITIDTETFTLNGSTVVSKVFAGFVNWLGHLFSDMAGSSGASGRGSGIPIPFYSLLQFVDVGEFGQHKQSFATVAVRVFEQGYDLRHGMALSVPVLITELLARVMWSVKQAFYHQRPLLECLPAAANPELRRMLAVAHGSLCLVDAADASLRSGGDMIQFMLRSNLVAWARFGTLALREMKAYCAEGSLDCAAVDDYLDAEYRRMVS